MLAGIRMRIGIGVGLRIAIGAAWIAGAGAACAADDAAREPDGQGAPGAADAGAAEHDVEVSGGSAAPTAPDGDADAGPAGASRAGSAGRPLHILQMNLCNSGQNPGCFSGGQSVAEAYQITMRVQADVVTLNEICEDDVATELFGELREAWAADWTYWVFAPAKSRRTGGPLPCNDGQRYGVGIIGHVPAAAWSGFEFDGDRYAHQDLTDNEMRAWACASLGGVEACTTHLQSRHGDVALLQCQELMDPVLPQFRAGHGDGSRPSIVSGDLNLAFGGDPDVQSCLPPGWFRKGDTQVQHVMATDDFTYESTELIPMERSDHDALLVRLIAP